MAVMLHLERINMKLLIQLTESLEEHSCNISCTQGKLRG